MKYKWNISRKILEYTSKMVISFNEKTFFIFKEILTFLKSFHKTFLIQEFLCYNIKLSKYNFEMSSKANTVETILLKYVSIYHCKKSKREGIKTQG